MSGDEHQRCCMHCSGSGHELTGGRLERAHALLHRGVPGARGWKGRDRDMHKKAFSFSATSVHTHLLTFFAK